MCGTPPASSSPSACPWVRSSTVPVADAPGAGVQGVHSRRGLDPLLHEGALGCTHGLRRGSQGGIAAGDRGIVVFQKDTCMVAATLNMIKFYARESCGWCTPCREGLPYVRWILEEIESGRGEKGHIEMLREHVKHLNLAFCALAPAPWDRWMGFCGYSRTKYRNIFSGKAARSPLIER